MMFISECVSLILVCVCSDAMTTLDKDTFFPKPGTHGNYAVLTGKVHTPPPFKIVDIVYGPREKVENQEMIWWQMSVRAESDNKMPLFMIRALTTHDPLSSAEQMPQFHRYLLYIPETEETLEYRNVNTGKALLPVWKDFHQYFVPRRAKGSYVQKGLPETLEYMGHVLTLHFPGKNIPWGDWDDAKVLELDPELLVGTGRNFKDSEGHRLPQEPERQNYDYIKFVEEDYKTMIDAGINLFTISPDQQEFIIDEPVFYIRQPEGDPSLRFPADLYRSNYLGSVMFMDEPAIIMVGDENIHKDLMYFSDAAAVLKKRVKERYYCGSNYSAFKLETSLKNMGVNLGDMRLEQYDYPAWETLYDMAFYEVEAEVNGVVHEGRYQLKPFDEAVAKWADTPRQHTTEELLRYHFAFLRGGARAFDKYWGTSIYGQCDPDISPEAIKLAYDMGARYIWFWTSDHEHHMPWPEQLELVKTLRKHESENPRQSINGPKKELDTAIVIPYGYFLSLGNLWWVRSLDEEGKSEASQRYDKIMQRSIKAIHNAMDRGDDFDILVDDGREIQGYRRIIYINHDE
ncbi:hypothetical protein GF312_15255 [Candidatus Poribacteria bacterium]|nr:hypothetical protein [Candidatus Poribacteria bacterium]